MMVSLTTGTSTKHGVYRGKRCLANCNSDQETGGGFSFDVSDESVSACSDLLKCVTIGGHI